MTKYVVVLQDSTEKTIEGEILIIGDDGQMIIYDKNDISYKNIVAVVPKTAMVFKSIKSKV